MRSGPEGGASGLQPAPANRAVASSAARLRPDNVGIHANAITSPRDTPRRQPRYPLAGPPTTTLPTTGLQWSECTPGRLDAMTTDRRSVGILLFDDVEVLDFAGPFE